MCKIRRRGWLKIRIQLKWIILITFGYRILINDDCETTKSRIHERTICIFEKIMIMKSVIVLFATLLLFQSAIAQENDIEIFEKKEGNQNIVMARNIGKVSYLVKLNIEAEGMIVSPGLKVEAIVPPGYMKSMATLEPKPGMGWSYGYDVSFVEYAGELPNSEDETSGSDPGAAANSSVEVPVPPTTTSVSDAAIVVYTRQGCGRCSFMKKELKKKEIKFAEVDVNSGLPEADEMWKLLRESGFTGTSVTMPVVRVNGELHYNIKDMSSFINDLDQ